MWWWRGRWSFVSREYFAGFGWHVVELDLEYFVWFGFYDVGRISSRFGANSWLGIVNVAGIGHVSGLVAEDVVD